MRLIALTANQPSFKSVAFNRSGLTLVVGRHRTARKTDLKKTYNGVGKSLLVALVNYCLGSNKNEHFDTHLPEWALTLTFEHAGKTHRVTRTTGETKILFDDEQISLAKYKDRLEELGAFSMPAEDINFLTFRSLLSFFLRPKNGSYIRYDRPQPEWKEYQSVLCQSFLLGLDYYRAVQKYEQKKRLDEQSCLANRYKQDNELREFYLGEKNAEVELLELGSEIKRLEADLAAFRVAENYADASRRLTTSITGCPTWPTRSSFTTTWSRTSNWPCRSSRTFLPIRWSRCTRRLWPPFLTSWSSDSKTSKHSTNVCKRTEATG